MEFYMNGIEYIISGIKNDPSLPMFPFVCVQSEIYDRLDVVIAILVN